MLAPPAVLRQSVLGNSIQAWLVALAVLVGGWALLVLARRVLLLQAASWGNGAIALWLERAARRTGQHDKATLTTLNVLGVLARVVLWTLVFLLGLRAFHVDI